MYSKMLVIVVFVLALSFQGCNTLKGAAEGFKEDWKIVGEVDERMREAMW